MTASAVFRSPYAVVRLPTQRRGTSLTSACEHTRSRARTATSARSATGPTFIRDFAPRPHGTETAAVSLPQPAGGPSSSESTMNSLVHDVRYALRSCLRTPAFTVIAVAALAL